MKTLILTLALFALSFNGIAQFNDTIFYKSGMQKVVSIKDFTNTQIFYTTVNSKGKTVDSQVTKSVVRRFVMYDEDGTLQYNSKVINTEVDDMKFQTKFPSTVSVSKHSFSINPFFLPFLSASLKHNYRFGSKMQFSICSRATILGPLLDNEGYWGNVMFGTGFQITPFYNKRLAFGLDFVPMIGLYTDGYDDPSLMLPISVDFDFYITKNVGISADIGFGNIYDGSSYFGVRGHLGVLIQLNDKKTFETNY
ncbi:MAG: hypothetical protein GQ574_26230 [Crocinitomix sp.]|nr:hypothetical protein [Crocinitomix sp.]